MAAGHRFAQSPDAGEAVGAGEVLERSSLEKILETFFLT
jgi:hypothetical protein